MSRGDKWTRETPLMVSIAALYAFGLGPKEVANRLRCSVSTVGGALSWYMRYWSADSWRAAARLQWVAATQEEIAQ